VAADPASKRVKRIESFDPVSDPKARVLVLGSMPGKASLGASQYYAHPRNAFWPIAERLFGIAAADPYRVRLRGLVANRVALWDVMKACRRATSLDSDIVADSVVANDFAAFFAAHPRIERVFFNGAVAQSAYRRHVVATLDASRPLVYTRLPSTSPAHAALSFQQKLAAWRQIAR